MFRLVIKGVRIPSALPKRGERMIDLIKQLFEVIEALEKKISNNYKRILGLSKRIKKLEDNL